MNLADGNSINSAKISFDVDKMYQSEYRNTQVVAFFTLKEYKKLKLDLTSLYLNNVNKKVQNYLIELNKAKDKIFVNSRISDKGVWLIESDNDEYYKVTFFEN